MVVSDCTESDLFENPEGLEALISEPRSVSGLNYQTEQDEEGGKDERDALAEDEGNSGEEEGAQT